MLPPEHVARPPHATGPPPRCWLEVLRYEQVTPLAEPRVLRPALIDWTHWLPKPTMQGAKILVALPRFDLRGFEVRPLYLFDLVRRVQDLLEPSQHLIPFAKHDFQLRFLHQLPLNCLVQVHRVELTRLE